MTTSTFGAQTDDTADLPMRPRGARRSAIVEEQLAREVPPAAGPPAENWAEETLHALEAAAGAQSLRPRGGRRSAIADDQLFDEPLQPAGEAPAGIRTEPLPHPLESDGVFQDQEDAPAPEQAADNGIGEWTDGSRSYQQPEPDFAAPSSVIPDWADDPAPAQESAPESAAADGVQEWVEQPAVEPEPTDFTDNVQEWAEQPADNGVQDWSNQPAAEPEQEQAADSGVQDWEYRQPEPAAVAAAETADIPGEEAARAAHAAADAAALDLGLSSKSAELLHSLLVLSATDLSRGYPWRVHNMTARDWYSGFLFEDASSWLLGVGEAFSMRAFRTAMSGADALAAFNSLSLLCMTPGVREETSAGVQQLLADPARIARVLSSTDL